MKRFIFTVILLGCLLLPGLNSAQTGGVWYVNCGASTNGSGTQASPFNTLAAAQAAMEGSSSKMAFVSGTCTLAANWNLTSSDSGETWEGLIGGNATISGNVTSVTQPNPTSLCQHPAAYALTNGYYISVTGANNISFYNFTFTNLASFLCCSYVSGDDNGHGFGGLYLYNLTGATVRWNTFLSSTMSAITLSFVSGSLIDSNTINGVSDGYPSTFNASTTSGTDGLCYDPEALIDNYPYGNYSGAPNSGNTISHNLIENTQGGGIGFDGNNEVIDSNVMTNVGNVAYDFGMIASEDTVLQFSGTQVTNNLISNWGGAYQTVDHDFPLYYDSGTSGVTTTGNAICATQTTGGDGNSAAAFFMMDGAGENNTVTGNVFPVATTATAMVYYFGTGTHGSNTIEHNIFYSTGSFPGTIVTNTGTSSPNCPTITDNLFWSATSQTITQGSCPDSSPVYANPEFTNVSACNFAMPGNSPAITEAGFTQLATNQGPLPMNLPGQGGSNGGTGAGSLWW